MSPRFRKPSRVIAGRVIKAHGVLGWVKVEVLSSNPSRFRAGNVFYLEDGEEVLVLEASRPAPDALLVKFRGVDDREAASGLRGKDLTITPEQMGEPPEDAWWEHDLLALQVYDVDGNMLGEVTEVMETGANDVLVVRGEEREYLIPMISDVVVEVDLALERITVRPLPGLL